MGSIAFALTFYASCLCALVAWVAKVQRDDLWYWMATRALCFLVLILLILLGLGYRADVIAEAACQANSNDT